MAPDYKGLRTAENRYVEYTTGDRELYMTAAPYDLESLHKPALVAQLQARIEALRDYAGESCRAAEEAAP